MKKLVAILACRNAGSRLYGKPLQNLDIKNNITILDNLISCIKTLKCVDEICLAISNQKENICYEEYAKKNNLRFIYGDEIDVLGRLIIAGNYTNATDIFRVTSECPFLYFDEIDKCAKIYFDDKLDFITQDKLIDGIGWSITKLKALEYSHIHGEDKHKSEFCHLYIRENMRLFKTKIFSSPAELIRKDLRLTVDYPEDLIICRDIYLKFKDKAPKISVKEIVKYLDKNPNLKKLVYPFVEEGYLTMY
jgi:spore coat polysaccharide biosynthesis protein SpsF